MAMTMEAPATLSDEPIAGVKQPEPAPPKTGQEENRPTSAPPPKKTLADANAELTEVGRENQNAAGQAAAEVQAETATVVDDEEKRFWAEISTIGKITDCSENIEECEKRINELKEEIKVEKEMLKGEQHRLQKLSIELRKIKTGHPLPVDPNAKKEEEANQAAEDQASDGEQSDDAWRAKSTAELLDGLKGLGQKKLDALVEAAPTAGDLEDLRGEASRAHLSFKEKLPNGFGQKIADAIEDRLIEHVAKSAPSAEEQAAAEREANQDDETPFDDGEPNAVAGKIEQREREQLAEATQSDEPDASQADDEYEDVDKDDIP